ncbi:cytochrome b6/f complex, alternative iron-sulfur subunit [[Synechococcus] sp. NIES-970]|uniref:QcrA and Rieske domain-containing protein n=1 Tax=Picosynechococcus sp. NKBG15041c TaxID=1407650 RepID=UPI00040E21C2|nr:Rieske (2Fe-2S) protein [Picosynechococcus sp. NKBG15041c]BAW95993.1 cytochrome b6/f complex, alternative iron-sulfur subunit [[Synechococcus] sp. NIES-970]
MERRQFVGLFGLGLLASSLPTILAACSANSNPEDAAGEFTTVGTVGELDGNGVFSTEVNGKSVYIFRNPDDQSLIALDPTCNHRGCPAELAGNDLVCDCHGSRFALDGSLLQGPATAGLSRYEVRQEGDNILVKVA